MKRLFGRKLKQFSFGVAFLCLFVIIEFAAANVLVNGDFETIQPPPLVNGNNSGHSILPWIIVPGPNQTNLPNLVQVDGPSGFDYGTDGPESDASAPGPGILQHYLDIDNGKNDFYQSFTPRCSGIVTFGGAFSTRADSGGSSTITLRNGVGTSGSVVGTTQTISFSTPPALHSKTDPWKVVSFTANVVAGNPYSFVVHMTDNMNFDNGFVTYNDDCPENVIKICKVAGPGVTEGTPFTFSVGSNIVTVPAGPPPGGYCVVGPSVPTGTSFTVTETIPTGVTVSSIVVAPPAQSVGQPNLGTGTVTVAASAGITEVTYTDERRTGFLEICKSGDVHGNFAFNVSPPTISPGGSGPFTIPAGGCSPAFLMPAGPVTITEVTSGALMIGCSAIPASRQGLCNTSGRASTVTVVPGDISTQTIATIVNRPTGDPTAAPAKSPK